jgi:hypothetical protein
MGQSLPMARVARVTSVSSWLVGLLLAAALAAFLRFVWPTPWRPLPIATAAGQPRILAAREHRWTGRVELLTRIGWVPATPTPGAASPPVSPTMPMGPARDTAGRPDTADPLAGYTPDWRTRRPSGGPARAH